jgi:hypothetical protein
MSVCLFLVIFLPAIETNDTECTQEGEVFEYQEEEDQGQANQGKPSILDAYLILFTSFAYFLKVYENAYFLYIAIVCVAIIDGLPPQIKLLSSLGMTPFDTIQHPCSSGLMVSIQAFGKLVVEHKTLGWEH